LYLSLESQAQTQTEIKKIQIIKQNKKIISLTFSHSQFVQIDEKNQKFLLASTLALSYTITYSLPLLSSPWRLKRYGGIGCKSTSM
jgi:hypothetical protein